VVREVLEEHFAAQATSGDAVAPDAPRGGEQRRRRRGGEGRRVFPLSFWAEEYREYQALAVGRGLTVTELLRQVLALGRAALVEAEGVPLSKAAELLQELSRTRLLLEVLGPQVLASVELGAAAAALASGEAAREESLAAEARQAGHEQWEQLVDELGASAQGDD
jgi:hypothetical protein